MTTILVELMEHQEKFEKVILRGTVIGTFFAELKGCSCWHPVVVKLPFWGRVECWRLDKSCMPFVIHSQSPSSHPTHEMIARASLKVVHLDR